MAKKIYLAEVDCEPIIKKIDETRDFIIRKTEIMRLRFEIMEGEINGLDR